jgi:phage-related protein
MTGVRFGNIHSYDDLGLTLTEIEITPPEPKTYRVSLPGADGDIDLTEALTGDIKYNTRTISIVFGVIGDWQDVLNKYSEVQNSIHGRHFDEIIFDDDANYYHVGRVAATALGADPLIGTITVQCIVDPYKYDWGDDWLWDPFNFDTEVINEVGNLTVSGNLDVMYIGKRRKYTPSITVSSAMQVEYNGVTYSLEKGKNKILDIQFTEGENYLTFTGNGTVSIENKGGSF